MSTLHPYLGVSKKAGYKTKKVNECNKKNQRRYGLHCHKKKEKKLIKWMEDNKPYQTALKRLIWEQIEREETQKKKNSVNK